MVWFKQQRHERLGRKKAKGTRRPAVARQSKGDGLKPVAWRWAQRPDLGTVAARTKSEARGLFKRLIPAPPRRNTAGTINRNEKHRLPIGAKIERVPA